MANVIKVFGSVSEFDAYLKDRKNTKAWQHHHGSETDGEADWYGTGSWDEAQDMLVHGDRKNYKKLIKEARATAKPQYRINKQLYSAVVGVAPNVAAYCAGAQNAMIAQRAIKVKQKVANICYTATFTYGVSTDDIIRTSLAVLQKVIALEANGTRVNLYLSHLMCDTQEGGHYGFAIKIKDARQALDVLKTVYPMVNASMLRRHAFRFWETTEGVPYVYGYGRPIGGAKDYERDLREAGLRDVKVISGKEILAAPNMAEAIEEALQK